jgi:hypothetical protein
MSTPGYYKTNPRALSVRGLTRKWGLLAFPLTYLITRFKKASPGGWMPMLWKDLECTKQDLSDRFWQATARQRKDFTALGFTELGFKSVKKGFLNPLIRDNGGANYLDASRRHFGQLIYNRAFYPQPISAEREIITIAFTAVVDRVVLACTNNRSPLDSLPGSEVLRVQSDAVVRIYQAFTEHLARRAEPPQHFPDDASLHSWFDDNAVEVFEYRVRTGLFIKMTDEEVAAARRKFPPPLPKP